MSGSSSRGRGTLLVIGGNEDPDEEHMRILPRLVELAGGKRSRILVCSAPSAEPERKVRVYRKVFEKIGIAEYLEAPITRREEAEREDLIDAAERATAVFFTGGDQLRLTALVAGTRFLDLLEQRHAEDRLVLAGTSAGAAAMGSTMIIGGPSGGGVRRKDVDLAPGLGILDDVIVDTHFNERGRVHRLLTVFAQNPSILGIGIDENTALELEPGTGFTVLGEGSAMVFDGRVSHSSAPDRGDAETLTVTDSVVHVLAEGYGFDFRRMRPLLPEGAEIPVPRSLGERP